MLQGKPEPQKLRKWWNISAQINMWSIPRAKQVFVVILLTFTPFSISNNPDITIYGLTGLSTSTNLRFLNFLNFIPLWVRCPGVSGCGWQDVKIQLITVIIGWEAIEQLVLGLGRRGAWWTSLSVTMRNWERRGGWGGVTQSEYQKPVVAGSSWGDLVRLTER